MKRRKIRLIESNAKLTCKGNMRQVFYLLEAPSPPMTPPPPQSLSVVSILIHTERGGGGELTSEKVRGAIVHKAGRKYQHH
jgi:hypothetical protein